MVKSVIYSVAVGLALFGAATAGTKSDMDPAGQWAAGRSGWGGGGGGGGGGGVGGGYSGGYSGGWGSDVSSGLVFVGLPLLLLIPLLFLLPYLLHSGHGGGHGGGWGGSSGGGGGGGGGGGWGGWGRSDGGNAAAAHVQRKTDQLTQQILPKL